MLSVGVYNLSDIVEYVTFTHANQDPNKMIFILIMLDKTVQKVTLNVISASIRKGHILAMFTEMKINQIKAQMEKMLSEAEDEETKQRIQI